MVVKPYPEKSLGHGLRELTIDGLPIFFLINFFKKDQQINKKIEFLSGHSII